MMQVKKLIYSYITKIVVESALQKNANQTTCGIVFQPKIPQELQRFKKYDK